MKELYEQLGISSQVYDFCHEIEESLKERFEKFDKTAEYNQMKVLLAMQKNRVSEECFGSSSGYGYNDYGRDTLEKVYADTFHTEACLVRPQIACGTHALAIALFGNLRPGDEMLAPAGKPYDTLEEIIGIRGEKGNGSLIDFGVKYEQVDLVDEMYPDYDEIAKKAVGAKIAYIQRSRGYSLRPSLTVEIIGKIAETAKKANPDIIVMVDNCYGEFVERKEPLSVGADIIIGSLIKNPGGGIASTGGYICGRADLVEKCADRLTCVGMGKEVGCSLNQNREMLLGFFLAPQVVASALKTSVFACRFFEKLGYKTLPESGETRTDIIASILLENEENLVAFCQGIQKGSPVDSYVTPEAWDMPGYDSKVIMAAGAFTMGASIELSADAPIRPPFAAWLQGGITYSTGKAGVMLAAQEMYNKGLLRI